MQKDNQYAVGGKTLFISYFSQFLQYGISLLILPFVLRFLEAEDLGMWYIFLSISSLVSLLDFGFAPSIQRNMAYVASGAKSLLPNGINHVKENKIDRRLLTSIIKTSCNIYKKISIAIFLLSIIFGTIYLFICMGDNYSYKTIFIWILYSISLSIYFYFNYILSFIKGLGLIIEYNKNIIISKTIYIISLSVLVYFGFGLLSLVIAYFINSLIMIVLGFKDIKKIIPDYSDLIKKKDFDNLFEILWVNAKNSGIVSIGVFLLSQSGVFLSGLFLSISEVAQLGLLLQLFGILVVVSRVYLTTCMPQMSSLWIKGDIKELKHIFLRCQLSGYLIFIIGFFIILFLGNSILENIIHSNVLLPSYVIIVLYGFFYLMEITHGNCCSFISTSNRIPFTKASIISGIISIVMTILLSAMDFGMISFPLALLCGSLPYNSWKWPLYAYNLINQR